jgi:hypothetical protein
MDVFSELGPLDVQLSKENKISAARSGLLSRASFESLQDIAFDLFEHFMLKIVLSSMGAVSFRVASELSANISAGLLTPVYAQMNPDLIGSDYRDLNVALQYGLRLARVSKNASISTVFHLVEHYPSHDFIIDNEEAGELFENVEDPSEQLYDLLATLGERAYIEQDSPFVCTLTQLRNHQHEGGSDGDDHKDPEMAQDGSDHRPGDPKPPDQASSASSPDSDPEEDAIHTPPRGK